MVSEENNRPADNSGEGLGALPADIKKEFLNSLGKKNKTPEKSVAEAAPVPSPEKPSVGLFDKPETVEKQEPQTTAAQTKAPAEKPSEPAEPAEKKETAQELVSLFSQKPPKKEPVAGKQTKRAEKTKEKKKTDAKAEPAHSEKPAAKERAPKALKNGQLPLAKAIPGVMVAPSVLLLLLPAAMKIGTAATYPVAAIFWLSLLFTGFAMLGVKLAYAGNIRTLYSGKSKQFRLYRFFSVINFFRNKKARIADCFFFLMTAVLVIVMVASAKIQSINSFLVALVFSLFLLSLNFHVYLNDSIYEYSVKNKSDKKDVMDNE